MGNYPTQQLTELPADFVSNTVSCLQDLAKQGIPQTDEELTARIDAYFDFCAAKGFRPGIESLALALSTSRQNFWMWCNGGGHKSREWQQACLQARQTVIAFLEACGLNGKVNPAALIFCLKNWANYTDSVSLSITDVIEDAPQSVAALPRFSDREDEQDD